MFKADCVTTSIRIRDCYAERLGIQGLASQFFRIPAFYFTDRGRVAGRVNGSYDILITSPLTAQPQFELNFYNFSDRSRDHRSGLSDLDAGMRTRYEFNRKFAPYIGFAYTGSYGPTQILCEEGRNVILVSFSASLAVKVRQPKGG